MNAIKKLLFISAILCAASVRFVYAANIQIECWGSGGAGGWVDGEGNFAGGGGGAYSRVNAFATVASGNYAISITGTGTSIGYTTFNSTTLIAAPANYPETAGRDCTGS